MLCYKKLEQDISKKFQKRCEKLLEENKDIYIISLGFNKALNSIELKANTEKYLNENKRCGETTMEGVFLIHKYNQENWKLTETLISLSDYQEDEFGKKEIFSDKKLVDICFKKMWNMKKQYPKILFAMSETDRWNKENKKRYFIKINGTRAKKEYEEYEQFMHTKWHMAPHNPKLRKDIRKSMHWVIQLIKGGFIFSFFCLLLGITLKIREKYKFFTPVVFVSLCILFSVLYIALGLYEVYECQKGVVYLKTGKIINYESEPRTVTLGYNTVYRPQNYKVTRKDYYVTINYRGKKEKIEIKHPFMTNGKLQKMEHEEITIATLYCDKWIVEGIVLSHVYPEFR
ncbi:MAG: hypothetical protein HDT30_05455 [Clostridiales bacterium]|nr:hypothetical protein [Clostridiales bacterium]